MQAKKIPITSLQRLFLTLAKSIDQVGYNQTMHNLNAGIATQTTAHEVPRQVLFAVCEVFDSLTPSELLNGNSRKYPRKYAFGIWVHVLFHDYRLNLPEIGNYLVSQGAAKHKSGLSRAKTLIERISQNPENKFDAKILNKLHCTKQKLNILHNEQPDTDTDAQSRNTD